MCAVRTRSQQNDGGDNQGTDDEDDQQGDGYSLPVPLRRSAAHKVLKKNTHHIGYTCADTRAHMQGPNIHFSMVVLDK